MLKSMTGFGRVKAENERREISVEIRSVNHRYLDLNIKVPRLYAYLEDPVKKTLTGSLARGKVDVYVNIREKDGSDVKISLNEPVADAYMNAIKALSDKYGIPQSVTALDLIRLSDVLSVDKEEADAEQLIGEVLEVLRAALAEYDQMRTAEGERLCEDIRYRGQLIADMVSQVEARSPNSVEEYRVKLAARMQELLEGTDPDPQRILNEAALFADKVSVTEEIVRLRSHLKQLDTLLQSPVAVGRKLDFLVQEMNRETNTIGSKANDYAIAKIVVDQKAEIEKIREQIQNLE